MDRYARQSVFSHIGKAGQEKLAQARVVIIGMGALGTVSANCLCRAGVGHIRMVDRDYVELTNLQRQMIYTEEDARQSLPKAAAAHAHLSQVNSDITLEPIIADANPGNIEHLLEGANLVLDATDNWETRLLINETCHAHSIPWVYCGVLGAAAMTMNILPGEPCLRCFIGDAGAAPGHSCATFGVLNMTTNAIASIQAAEALKILIGSKDVRRGLLTMDLWSNQIDTIQTRQRPDCPVCAHGRYEYFGHATGSYTTALCGGNSVQVAPAVPTKIDFDALAEKLRPAGQVRQTPFSLIFSNNKHEITLFADGRALIKNAESESHAKSLYAEYIGL